jgi:uroporphyrinogen decarboxylase
MFEEFLLPYYKKLTGFFLDNGIEVILVDTDGDCRPLIPLFIEGGTTGLYPMQVTGGMDVVTIGQQYPDLQLIGGLDKVAISRGPEAIDRELETKVPPLLRRGGYIPMADHLVPPDVSWDDFVYYRRKLASMGPDHGG